MTTFELLSKGSESLARHASIFVILFAVVAYFCNPSFSWVNSGQNQTLLLGLIMLTMGITLTTEDFKALAARPGMIFIGTFAQFTIMPLIAKLLSIVFNFPDGVTIGLLLVGCCPGGVSSNIMSYLCKGDVALSVGMTTLNTLLAPVVTPLLMLMLSGETVEIDAIGMFTNILCVTIMPIICGFALNHFVLSKPKYANAKNIMPGLSVICLACIVGGVVAMCGNRLISSAAMFFGAIFMHNTLGYILGYSLGTLAKFGAPQRRTLSLEVGMQNAGLATNLASRHFVQYPDAAIISALCCSWHSISGTILANIFEYAQRRNHKD